METFAGDSVEFHASGMITFPLLGTRAAIADKLAFLGVKIDEEKNAAAKHTSVEFDLSTPDAKVKMLMIPTNEELMIAKDTLELVSK